MADSPISDKLAPLVPTDAAGAPKQPEFVVLGPDEATNVRKASAANPNAERVVLTLFGEMTVTNDLVGNRLPVDTSFAANDSRTRFNLAGKDYEIQPSGRVVSSSGGGEQNPENGPQVENPRIFSFQPGKLPNGAMADTLVEVHERGGLNIRYYDNAFNDDGSPRNARISWRDQSELHYENGLPTKMVGAGSGGGTEQSREIELSYAGDSLNSLSKVTFTGRDGVAKSYEGSNGAFIPTDGQGPQRSFRVDPGNPMLGEAPHLVETTLIGDDIGVFNYTGRERDVRAWDSDGQKFVGPYENPGLRFDINGFINGAALPEGGYFQIKREQTGKWMYQAYSEDGVARDGQRQEVKNLTRSSAVISFDFVETGARGEQIGEMKILANNRPAAQLEGTKSGDVARPALLDAPVALDTDAAAVRRGNAETDSTVSSESILFERGMDHLRRAAASTDLPTRQKAEAVLRQVAETNVDGKSPASAEIHAKHSEAGRRPAIGPWPMVALVSTASFLTWLKESNPEQ